MLNVSHEFADLSEVSLHYVEAGEGPLVILLHGFPDFWRAWVHQIEPLANAGFRVVVPDMRGYNRSSKPRGAEHYSLDKLTGDVAELVEYLGEESCFLAGHDWGAVVAWSVPTDHPGLVDKLMIFNVPHSGRMARGLRTFSQMKKSWYIFAFQLPWMPEKLVSRNDFEILKQIFQKDPVNPDAFDEEEIEHYLQSWRRSENLHGPINYYRAAARNASIDLRRIEIPVRVIWGRHDAYLGEELAEPDPKIVPTCSVKFLDASHWVMHDAPEVCAEEMIAFFAED